jgi:hypothetical protein
MDARRLAGGCERWPPPRLWLPPAAPEDRDAIHDAAPPQRARSGLCTPGMTRPLDSPWVVAMARPPLRTPDPSRPCQGVPRKPRNGSRSLDLLRRGLRLGGSVAPILRLQQDRWPADAIAHGDLAEGPVALFAADVTRDEPAFRCEGMMLSLLGTAPPSTLRIWRYAGRSADL